MARPTKVQSTLMKIERYRQSNADDAADLMVDLFNELKGIAFDKNATHASRLSAIKTIFEYIDQYYLEQKGLNAQGKPKASALKEDEDDGLVPLISKRF
jgi:hypothetical protein